MTSEKEETSPLLHVVTHFCSTTKRRFQRKRLRTAASIRCNRCGLRLNESLG